MSKGGKAGLVRDARARYRMLEWNVWVREQLLR